jgi:hypothetical protein
MPSLQANQSDRDMMSTRPPKNLFHQFTPATTKFSSAAISAAMPKPAENTDPQ